VYSVGNPVCEDGDEEEEVGGGPDIVNPDQSHANGPPGR